MNAVKNQSKRGETQSRRLVLKRFAILGAVVLAPALLGVSGCETVKGIFHEKPAKQNKTIDDVLSEERPSW